MGFVLLVLEIGGTRGGSVEFKGIEVTGPVGMILMIVGVLIEVVF